MWPIQNHTHIYTLPLNLHNVLTRLWFSWIQTFYLLIFFFQPSLALCLKKSIKCHGKILETIAATETCSSVIQTQTTKKENNKLPRHFSMTIYNSRCAYIVKYYEKWNQNASLAVWITAPIRGYDACCCYKCLRKRERRKQARKGHSV